MSDTSNDITEDAFLNGKLRLRQPRRGHRAGHDAMLLAAATPARINDRVIDFGAGVGAAGLAVARRVSGIKLVLVEIDVALAGLARTNAALNMLDAQVETLDVAASAEAFAAVDLSPDSADVVLMNPPFNEAARHRPSPDAGRQAAHLATATTLEDWVHAARRVLKSGGTLTLIWRADGLAEVLAALDRGFGSLAILPIHSDPEASAIRILIKAVKGGRAPMALYPGLMLRDAGGAPNAEVQTILAGEGILPLAATGLL